MVDHLAVIIFQPLMMPTSKALINFALVSNLYIKSIMLHLISHVSWVFALRKIPEFFKKNLTFFCDEKSVHLTMKSNFSLLKVYMQRRNSILLLKVLNFSRNSCTKFFLKFSHFLATNRTRR